LIYFHIIYLYLLLFLLFVVIFFQRIREVVMPTTRKKTKTVKTKFPHLIWEVETLYPQATVIFMLSSS